MAPRLVTGVAALYRCRDMDPEAVASGPVSSGPECAVFSGPSSSGHVDVRRSTLYLHS